MGISIQYQAIISGSDEVGKTLRLQVAQKLTNNGKLVPVFASCRVPVKGYTLDAVISELATVDGVISWKVPKTEYGESIKVQLQISPKMSAVRVHVLFSHLFGFKYGTGLTTDAINGHLAAMGLPATKTETVPDASNGSIEPLKSKRSNKREPLQSNVPATA